MEEEIDREGMKGRWSVKLGADAKVVFGNNQDHPDEQDHDENFVLFACAVLTVFFFLDFVIHGVWFFLNHRRAQIHYGVHAQFLAIIISSLLYDLAKGILLSLV